MKKKRKGKNILIVIGFATLATIGYVGYMATTTKPYKFDLEAEYKHFLNIFELFDTPENRQLFIEQLHKD